MVDPYRNANDPARIQTKQDRREKSVEAIKDGLVAGAKSLGSAVMQALYRAIPQGASELAGALIPSSAVVQNLDPQLEPQVGSPQQEEGQQQSGGIEPPKREEAASETRAEAVRGYMMGYKPPVRVDHNTMYTSPGHSQSQSM